MRKYLLMLFLLCSTQLVRAQMSDTQVAQYIQQEMRAGTTQSQIAVSLMERGVKMEQIQRVREQYEKKVPMEKASLRKKNRRRRMLTVPVRTTGHSVQMRMARPSIPRW